MFATGMPPGASGCGLPSESAQPAIIATRMPFELNHFSVGDGPRIAFVLHGALGNSRNFRAIAKRLHGVLPDWRFVCVDLRNHGESHPAPPPQTLDACTGDLRQLALTIGEAEVVIGHSFGGKVALAYAESGAPPLSQVWVLDANPGPITIGPPGSPLGEVETVIRAIRSIPLPLRTRNEVVNELTAQGFSHSLAQWMTTNLRRTSDGYEWVFNLDAIETLMADYRVRDFWPYLISREKTASVHMVIAEKSARLSADIQTRLESLNPAAGVFTHVLPNAGHWVHVDNPDGLMALFSENWPRE